MPAKSDGRENTELATGILPLHISSGILLCIAIGLRPLESLRKGNAILHHPGENVVGRAVENAADFQNIVGCHALTQGAQDRNTSSNTGFKQIDRLMLCRQFQQAASVGGHQLFIGCNDAFSRFQCPFCKIQGSAHTANGLNHHIDLRILLNDREILDKASGKRAVRKIPHIQYIF